jgi:3-oxoacyl-[acyl-carrier protein] reductase
MMDLELAGKVVLITGGSKGIGYATAEDFAREKCRVVICARGVDALKDAAARLEAATGQKVDWVQADVTKVADIDGLIAHVRDRYGVLDVLVNNAGTGTYKPFLEVTDDELVNGMTLNFFSMFRVTQRAVPLMAKSNGGSIVNVSGRSGVRGTFPPGSSCTGPAKAAEIRFSIDLAAELAQFGIRVNVVVPGIVETPERFTLWEKTALKKDLDENTAASLRKDIEKVSMVSGRKWGQPKEVSDCILFLASPRSSYVNGASLQIDGGSFNTSYISELHNRRDTLGGST